MIVDPSDKGDGIQVFFKLKNQFVVEIWMPAARGTGIHMRIFCGLHGQVQHDFNIFLPGFMDDRMPERAAGKTAKVIGTSSARSLSAACKS